MSDQLTDLNRLEAQWVSQDVSQALSALARLAAFIEGNPSSAAVSSAFLKLADFYKSTSDVSIQYRAYKIVTTLKPWLSQIANGPEFARRLTVVTGSTDDIARLIVVRLLGCVADVDDGTTFFPNIISERLADSKGLERAAVIAVATSVAPKSVALCSLLLDQAHDMITDPATDPETQIKLIACIGSCTARVDYAMKAGKILEGLIPKFALLHYRVAILRALGMLSRSSTVAARKFVPVMLDSVRVGNDMRALCRQEVVVQLAFLVRDVLLRGILSADQLQFLFDILEVPTSTTEIRAACYCLQQIAKPGFQSNDVEEHILKWFVHHRPRLWMLCDKLDHISMACIIKTLGYILKKSDEVLQRDILNEARVLLVQLVPHHGQARSTRKKVRALLSLFVERASALSRHELASLSWKLLIWPREVPPTVARMLLKCLTHLNITHHDAQLIDIHEALRHFREGMEGDKPPHVIVTINYVRMLIILTVTRARAENAVIPESFRVEMLETMHGLLVLDKQVKAGCGYHSYMLCVELLRLGANEFAFVYEWLARLLLKSVSTVDHGVFQWARHLVDLASITSCDTPREEIAAIQRALSRLYTLRKNEGSFHFQILFMGYRQWFVSTLCRILKFINFKGNAALSQSCRFLETWDGLCDEIGEGQYKLVCLAEMFGIVLDEESRSCVEFWRAVTGLVFEAVKGMSPTAEHLYNDPLREPQMNGNTIQTRFMRSSWESLVSAYKSFETQKGYDALSGLVAIVLATPIYMPKAYFRSFSRPSITITTSPTLSQCRNLRLTPGTYLGLDVEAKATLPQKSQNKNVFPKARILASIVSGRVHERQMHWGEWQDFLNFKTANHTLQETTTSIASTGALYLRAEASVTLPSLNMIPLVKTVQSMRYERRKDPGNVGLWLSQRRAALKEFCVVVAVSLVDGGGRECSKQVWVMPLEMAPEGS